MVPAVLSSNQCPYLEVRGLTRSYYGVHALRGVDLSVEAGRITGLIGPNGAGKTTLFNCISELVPPDAGSVRFDDLAITGWRPDRVTGAGLVRTFQIARGFPRLSVLENLLLSGTRQPGERLVHAALRTSGVRRREGELREHARAIAQRLKISCVCWIIAPANCPVGRRSCWRSAAR